MNMKMIYRHDTVCVCMKVAYGDQKPMPEYFLKWRYWVNESQTMCGAGKCQRKSTTTSTKTTTDLLCRISILSKQQKENCLLRIFDKVSIAYLLAVIVVVVAVEVISHTIHFFFAFDISFMHKQINARVEETMECTYGPYPFVQRKQILPIIIDA